MKGKTLQKLTAGLLALLLLAGGVTGQPFADLFADLVITASASGGALSGSGTQSDPYVINDADDWLTFAQNVNSGSGGGLYRTAHIKLSDTFDNHDSPIEIMVGTELSPFAGTFNGNGRTLYVDLTSGGNYCAPFRYVNGAVFMLLTTTGTVSAGENQFGTGLIGSSNGTITVTNCRSSVTVTSQINGDGTHGGFIGVSRGSVTFTNCLFDGEISGENTTCCAGFIGWRESGAAKYINCLMAGDLSIKITTDSAVFNRNGSDDMTNSYYSGYYGLARLQGDSTNDTGSNLQGKLGSGWQLVGEDVIPVTDSSDLALASVSGVQGSYDYTANLITVTPAVTDILGNRLTENTHYTASLTLRGSAVNEVRNVGEYKYTFTAINGSGYSGSKEFTFNVEGPPAPADLMQTEFSDSSVTLEWTQEGDVTGWVVQLATDKAFSSIVKTLNVTGTSEVSIDDLTTDQTYFARVKWMMGEASGKWCTPVVCEATNKRWIGCGTSSVNKDLPVNNNYRYSITQQIYTAAELGDSGVVTEIDFMIKKTDRTRKIDVYMVQTDKTKFESTNDWISVTESDKVFSGTVNFIADQWTNIRLPIPFIYDNSVENNNVALIVDDNTNYSSDNTYFYAFNGGKDTSIHLYSDSVDFDPTPLSHVYGNTDSYRNEIRFKVLSPNDIETAIVSGIDDEYEYTGEAIDVQPTLTTASYEPLYEDEHYTTELSLNGEPVSEVKEAGTYVYTFTAIDGSGYTGSHQVTFSVNLPEAPKDLICTNVTSDSVTLEWDQSGVPNDWVLQYSTDRAFESNVQTVEVSDTPTATITNLMTDTIYSFRVKWLCNGYESEWSSSVVGEPTSKRVVDSEEASADRSLPLDRYYFYCLSQQLYTPAELGSATVFTTVDFMSNGDEPFTRYIDIYMVHTDKKKFDSKNDWITVTEDDMVFRGRVTFLSKEWTSIKLDEPFAYNGTQSVALIVDDNTGNWGEEIYFRTVDSTESCSVYRCGDFDDYDPTGTVIGDEDNLHNTASRKNAVRFGTINENDLEVVVVDGIESSYGYTRDTIPVTPTLTNTHGVTLVEGTDYTSSLTFNGSSVSEVKEKGTYVYTFTATPDGSYTGSKSITFSVTDPPAPEDLAVKSFTGNSVTLEWTKNGYPSAWTVQYDTSDDFEDYHSVSVTNDPIATITGLTADTKYYFRVKWTDGNEESEWSDITECTPSSKIMIGVDSESSSYSFPTTDFFANTLTQQIYTKQEIGKECDITAIEFKMVSDRECTRNLDIYMIHTDKSAFDDSFDWIPVSSDDLVFRGNVTFTAYDWTTITLDRAFIYNGTQNVALVIDDNTHETDNVSEFTVVNCSDNTAMYVNNHSIDYDPTGDLSNIVGIREQLKNAVKFNIANEYDVIIDDGLQNGTLSVDQDPARTGRKVTVTSTPSVGYGVDTVSVNNGAVEVTKEGSNKYSFIMIDEPVTVSATFVQQDPCTVIWKDYDGTVLETDENVPFSMMPTYDGEPLSREHYTFVEWDPEVVIVAGDTTYTAVYTLEVFTVTFDEGDGKTTTQNVAYGDTIKDYTPIKQNKIFTGWSLGGEPFDVTTPISAPVTLTANWRDAEIMTVTFVDRGETVTRRVVEGEYAVRPDDPAREGYRFDGWFDENGTEFDFDNTPIIRDITLTAGWTEIKKLFVGSVFTVGDLVDFDDDYICYSPYSYSSFQPNGIIMIENCIIRGDRYCVNIDKDGFCLFSVACSEVLYDPHIKVVSGDGSSSSPFVFTSVDVISDTVHTVTWVGTDGTTTLRTDENVPWGSQAVYNGAIDVPDGYYLCWNDGTDTYYDGNMPIVKRNVTYTAVLSPIVPIHVGSVFTAGDTVNFAHYYYNTDDVESDVCVSNDLGIAEITSVDFEYGYGQYSVKPNGGLTIFVSSNNNDYEDNAAVKVVAGSGTYYDPFVFKIIKISQPESTFKVLFYDKGILMYDVFVNNNELLYEDRYALHDEFDVAFLGWIDENGDLFDFNTPITRDMKLTALWNIPLEVTFRSQDKQTVLNTAYVLGGTVLGKYQNYTPFGSNDDTMVFLGWFNEDGTQFDFGKPIMGDVTVHEEWALLTDVDDPVVTLMSYDNIMARMIVEYGETISEELSDISIDQNGFIFNGWYLDDALFDPDSPITESITLRSNIIADPAPNYHFVTFADGGKVYGRSMVADGMNPDDPPIVAYVPEGYALENWYYGDTPYDQILVTSDITVNAKWVIRDNIAARLAGHTLILGDDIGVNFYMELSEAVRTSQTAKMVFIIPDSGSTTPVEMLVSDVVNDPDLTTEHNGRTYFIFPCHVAAKEMTSEIKAQIIDEANELTGREYVYSVKQYADYIIAHPDEYGEKAVDLVKAMLYYGGTAQTLLIDPTPEAGALASCDLGEYEPLQLPANITKCDLDSITAQGLTLTSISLILESETALRLYFKADVSELPVIIDSDNNVYTAEQKGSEYYYEITGFAAGNIFDARTVQFAPEGTTQYNADDTHFDVCIGNYAEWAVGGSNDEALAAAIHALYNYDEYAKAYKDDTYTPGQGGIED